MAEFFLIDSRGYRHSLFVTEKSYDIATNTSVIEYIYQLQSGSNNGFKQYGIAWEVWINGNRVAYHAKKSGEYTCLKGENILSFVSGTVTIEHSADGSKSIECYAKSYDIDHSMSPRYTPDNDIQPSGTLKLTDIPRGFVWIDNGSSFERYQCYIDNGFSWDLYIPYIDNGSSWDMYS